VAIEKDRLGITDDGSVSLQFSLPPAVDLGALLGEHVRVTLRSEVRDRGPAAQLLTIGDQRGRVRLVAHYGPAQGNVHEVSGVLLRAALSQRDGGPLVFGTTELQCPVEVGQHVVLEVAGADLVMHFVARSPDGAAAYVIVDRAMWRAA